MKKRVLPGGAFRWRFLAICLFLIVCSGMLACNGCGSDDDDDSAPNPPGEDDDTGVGDDDSVDDDDEDDDQDDDIDDDDTTPEKCVGTPPGGGETTSLNAGVAVGELYAPVGISMGGFGARNGPKHPYAVLMGGSTGFIDRPNVKAVALDNGADRLVMARATLIFISDVLYTKVLDRVCERSGLDLREKLWLSGTHTHSGPDHFYPMPIPFGFVGTDTYDENITDRIADSIAETVVSAMEALEPAAMAVTIKDAIDPEDRWFKDRRCENNPPRYKEDRLFLARLDRADGSPMAAIVSWGVHGVVMKNTLMNSDAPGAVEHGLEKTFDTPVEVLFMQGAGGDVSPPRQSPYGHTGQQVMEWTAQSTGEELRGIFDGLVPSQSLSFEMVSKRIRISRARIGYQHGEFGYVSPLSGEFFEYWHGAFLCGDPDVLELLNLDDISIVDCDNPETAVVDGYLGCAWDNKWIMPWTWFFNNTQIANIRLGDTILSIMPGELTSLLSRHLREGLEEELGWPPEKIATFGYSQGHQMYLLREWDWFQGGYEASMNYWGPKLGDWLVEKNIELAAQLLTPEDEDNETGAPSAQRHPYAYSLCPTEFESGTDVGQVLDPVATAYERFDTVRFAWAGGYTGLGAPRVFFEIASQRGFVQVMLSDGRPLTDAGIETIIRYEPVPDYSARRFPAERLHRWSVEWELGARVAAGIYRIRVEGKAWKDDEEEAYTVFSEPFEIAPSTGLVVRNLRVEGLGDDRYRISCDGFWPPNPEGYRMRHPNYGPAEESPFPGGSVPASILVEGGQEESLALAPQGDGHFEGEFTMTQLGLAHSVEVRGGDMRDAYDNTNAQGAGPSAFP